MASKAEKAKKKAAKKKAARDFNDGASGLRAKRSQSVAATDTKIELAPLAATFLVSADACPKKARQDSGLKPSVIKNISLGRFPANADQAAGIYTAAKSQGWTPPNKG